MNMCVCVCETHTKLCLTPVRYSKARCKSWKTFRRWYRAIPCKSCRGRGLGVSVTRCRKVNHQPGPPLSPPPRFRFSPSCFRLLFITTWSRRVVSCKGSCKLFLLSFFLFFLHNAITWCFGERVLYSRIVRPVFLGYLAATPFERGHLLSRPPIVRARRRVSSTMHLPPFLPSSVCIAPSKSFASRVLLAAVR